MPGDYVTSAERHRLGVGSTETLYLTAIEFRDDVWTYQVHDVSNTYLGFICRRRNT